MSRIAFHTHKLNIQMRSRRKLTAEWIRTCVTVIIAVIIIIIIITAIIVVEVLKLIYASIFQTEIFRHAILMPFRCEKPPFCFYALALSRVYFEKKYERRTENSERSIFHVVKRMGKNFDVKKLERLMGLRDFEVVSQGLINRRLQRTLLFLMPLRFLANWIVGCKYLILVRSMSKGLSFFCDAWLIHESCDVWPKPILDIRSCNIIVLQFINSRKKY